MESKSGNAENFYINEIIRVTYKCNWKCKFCNVLKTNNFGEKDVTDKEVIYQILNLVKKYSFEERKSLILSFSGGEPTLNKNLIKYIRLAKVIGVGVVEIQTNGTMLFKNKNYILDLIDAGLNEIFLAQHSNDIVINNNIGSFYNIDDFKQWVLYILENNICEKIEISFNIVINKINLFDLFNYMTFLKSILFLNLLPLQNNNGLINSKRISFGLVQPNGYAELNKEEVLLKYNKEELIEINRIIKFCKENNIYPDFHFTAPPICILNYPEYNLEFHRLKQLEEDEKIGNINKGNLDSYKYLWKEKQKLEECNNCKNSKYCLGFYKNWIDFVGEDYVIEKINKFLK